MFKWISCVGVITMLLGCSGESEISIGEGVSVTVPQQLRGVQSLDNSDLILEVTVNEGNPVRIANQPNDNWVVNVDVPKGQSNDILVQWSGSYSGTKLLLAEFKTTVPELNDVLDIPSYDLTDVNDRFRFDEDGDGRTNLEELSENRNPLDRIDLVIPRRDTTFLQATIGFNFVEGTGDFIPNDTEKSEFSVWHNDQLLYLYVCVNDQQIHNDGGNPANPVFEHWEDDGVEIYLDASGNATPGGSFDTVDDFQFVYSPERGRTERYTNNVNFSYGNVQRPLCPNGSCSNHTFSSANCSYALSVQYDMAALGLSAGSEFGLDVEILDDDDGGSRDAKYVWIGDVNNSFDSPYTFGRVKLEGDSTTNITNNSSNPDSNGNGIPDGAESDGGFADDDGNGLIDLFETTAADPDINNNGIIDSIEVALTSGTDADGDGLDDNAVQTFLANIIVDF